jgi:hypothetical protein
VNIEYELENEGVTLYDLIISIPLPYVPPKSPPSQTLTMLSHSAGSYPSVSSHTGEWQLNPSSHSLDWSAPLVTPEDRSGSLEFSIGGDDAGMFFPVRVSFVAQGSVAGVRLSSVARADNGGPVSYSEDASVVVDSYTVV